MKIENDNIFTSRWMRSFLFLVLVYFSQASPFYHLHHAHEDDTLGDEISSRSLGTDETHSSDHHHDTDYPVTNDHRHHYDKQLDWHITGIQTHKKSLTFSYKYLHSSIPLVLTDGNSASLIEPEELRLANASYAAAFIVRGPPLLG